MGPTVYASNTGNDTTGNGSQGNPYQTIVKCLAVLGAGGGTILLTDGTFNETSGSGYLFFNTAYTAANPLVISSVSGNAANCISQGRGTAVYSIRFGNADYITFNNVTLNGQNTSQAQTVYFTTGIASNITFNNCIIPVKSNGAAAV